MDIHLTGVSHHTASISLRERLALAADDLPRALHAASALGAKSVVILSTCNRTEIIWRGNSEELGKQWMSKHFGIPATELADASYSHSGAAAIQHLFAVSAGIDSMVLGEPQILGQTKAAVATARESGTLDPILGRLFQHDFSAAKRIRHETEIGAGAVSVAYAAVKLGQRIFSDFSRHTALLVGAGETSELVAKHLCDIGLGNLRVINRDPARAEALAKPFNGLSAGLDQLESWLPEADIVISSTASRHSLISRQQVEQALQARRRKPMFFVDLAVPRDIDETVSSLSDVFLYTVDDLQELADDGLKQREIAAAAATRIIDEETERFTEWLQSLQAVDLIREVRESGEKLRDASLQKALRMLKSNGDPEEALHTLARELTNKLLHRPTERMREAGAKDQAELLGAAAQLFSEGSD